MVAWLKALLRANEDIVFRLIRAIKVEAEPFDDANAKEFRVPVMTELRDTAWIKAGLFAYDNCNGSCCDVVAVAVICCAQPCSRTYTRSS